MEKGFFIEKNDHEVAIKIAKMVEILAYVDVAGAFILYFVLRTMGQPESFVSGVYFKMILYFMILYAISVIISIVFRPTGVGEIRINDKYFRLEYGSFSRSGVWVDGIRWKFKYTQVKQIPWLQLPSVKENQYVNYLAYQLKDEKTVYFIICGFIYIYIDDVMIVQNDRIYQDRIDAIFGKAAEAKSNGTVDNAVPSNNSVSYSLKGISGEMLGKVWSLEQPIRIGRKAEACQVVFGETMQEVSEVHCEVGCRNGRPYIKDLGATHGTTLSNGTIVRDYKEYEVDDNTVITIGARESFIIMKN